MKTNFFLLITILSVAQTTIAQTDNADRLLWYKGKIIKPYVLLTSTGDTVFYNTQKRQVRVVSKGGAGRQFDGMLAELNNTQKRIDAVVKKLSGSVPRHLVSDLTNAVEKSFAEVEQELKPLLNNTITIPEGEFNFNANSIAVTGKGGPSFFTDHEGYDDDPFKKIVNKFREYREKHQNDDLGILPVPPRYNFNYCYPCDSNARQRYDKEVNHFIDEVFGIDFTLLNEAMSASRNLQLGAYHLVNNKTDKETIKTVSKAYDDEIWEFIQFILSRNAKKAANLLEKYTADAPRLPAIMKLVLPLHRNLQLMGEGINQTALTNLNYFKTTQEALQNYFSNAMKEKDYAVGLNLPFILRLERERQLIGNFLPGNQNLLEQYLAFNQFKLNSNITAKVSAEGGYIMGHVRGDNWFYAIVDKASCRLNWILASNTVEDRTAKYKLIAAEAPPGRYLGTKDWQSQAPVFKMEFCYKEGEALADSIHVNTFHPEGFREKWLFPPAFVMEVETVTGILTTSFLDVERIKEEAQELNKDKIEKMQKELQDKYAKLAVTNPSAMANMPQKMQADMEKLNREIREMLAKANPMKYIFTPKVNNKTKDIFKERLNGKEIFPQHPALEYAWFHLTMEHDPEGPYPIPSMQQLFSITK